MPVAGPELLMPEHPIAVSLSVGEYQIVSSETVGSLRIPGSRQVVVDSRNRPRLNQRRATALDRLERFRWWNSSAHFPEAPDVVRQTAALQDWFFGFAVTSALIMAPSAAGFAVIHTMDGAAGLHPAVGTAIAAVAAVLLIFVLHRLARPLWGRRGDPALVPRRALVLLLPAPVISAIWWLAFPAAGVRVVGLVFPFLYLLLLFALAVWFVLAYFRYTDESETREYLRNSTPAEALQSFHALLRPDSDPTVRRRRLETAVQYLDAFRESWCVSTADDERPGRWKGPIAPGTKTLLELGVEENKRIQALFEGDRLVEFALGGAVWLRPAGPEKNGHALLACCLLEAVSMGGVTADNPGACSATQVERRYVWRRVVSTSCGWMLGEARPAAEGEITQLRAAGAWP